MKKIGIIICLFALSCSKDDVNSSESAVALGKISKIESFKNITFGQSDTIVVTFSGGTNGCAQPDHIEATLIGFSTSLKAYYNYPTRPQPCPENLPIHTLKYIFKPTAKGTYIYKSFDSDVSDTTIVN